MSGTTLCTTEAREGQTEIPYTTLCTTEARDRARRRSLIPACAPQKKETEPDGDPLYHLVHHRSKRQSQTEIPLYHLVHHRRKKQSQTEIPYTTLCTTEARDRARRRSLYTTLCTTEARNMARRRSLWCLAPPCAPQKRETGPDGDPLYHLVYHLVQRGLTDEMDFCVCFCF